MRIFRLDTKATPEKIRDKRRRYQLASIDPCVATSVPVRTPAWQVLAAGPRFLSPSPRGSFLVPTILAAATRSADSFDRRRSRLSRYAGTIIIILA